MPAPLTLATRQPSPCGVETAAGHFWLAPDFGALPDAARRDTTARVALCERLDAAPRKAEAAAAEALRPVAGRVLSARTILNLWRGKWVATGRDWRSLIDRARWPDAERRRHDPAFVAHWHQLCWRFKGERRHRRAYRELERQWRAGEAMPGLADFAPGGRPGPLPEGCSYATLMRPPCRPTRLADRVANVGLKAAAPLLPGVLSTRAGLPFGARYVFDDMWHNFKVTVPGQMGARRLLQFHVLELLSGCQFARGYKPEILNDRSGRFERLKERELLFLIAHVLCETGYNAAGCILMMEHGTANVAGEKEDMIARFSNGAITIARGAISNGALAPGLYGGQSGGNPRFKAALESLGHLVQNELSDRLLLPMQTGTNSRLDAPEELYGQERHQLSLQKAALAIPPGLRAMLRLPAPPLGTVIEIADLLQEEMNRRDDHDLEGWEKCGFVAPEYRLAPDAAWAPQTQLLALPAAAREALAAHLHADPRLVRARRMSPREVFTGHAATLTRLPPHCLPALIGMEHAEERRAGKDGRFHFDADALGPDEHHYEGALHGGAAGRDAVRPGENYATFVSAVNPSRLYCCDAQGRFLGWCERTDVPSKADEHGLARAMGRKMQAHRELLAPVLAAARPMHQRIQRDIEANNAILRAAGATRRAPEPRARNRERARAAVLAEIAAPGARDGEAEGSLYAALNED